MKAESFGIVVMDLSGGDASYSFVDEERWKQILGLHAMTIAGGHGWKDRLIDQVGWLTADDRPETDPPKGAPERRGKLLKTVYTQTFVVERVGLSGELLGILTFP